MVAGPPTPAAPGAAERIRDRVREAIGGDRFAASFEHKSLFRIEDGELEVAVPNKILAGLLERRFGTLLREVAAGESGPMPVRFCVATDLFGPHAESAGDGAAAAESPAPKPLPHPQMAARRANPLARHSPVERYQLESFVVGESNRLAYNAAVGMAEDDSAARSCSPLFLHGPCGVGKTHLLSGVALRYKQRHPGATVRVTSGETFMNEYVAAVRAGDVEKFRRVFRRVDLLCVDDVHFLSNKQSTQGELLHTFDEIERCGARVVLASDEHPRYIKSFSAALVSRFMSGMVAEIKPPDADLRERVVRMFARARSLPLEDAAVRVLVERTAPVPGQAPTSVRDVEGLITKIDALHRLLPENGRAAEGGAVQGAGAVDGDRIGVIAVERALGGPSGDDGEPYRSARPVRVEAIIAHTCAALAIESTDLSGKTRHKRVVLARAVITHLARQMTTLSYPEIARSLGRPNHSTVITAHQRLARQIETDESIDAPGLPEARTVTSLIRQVSAAARSGAARR